MRLAALILLVCASVWAQDSPEIANARARIEKLRALVEAGAAPKLQLDRAEAALADAEDAAYLRKTVYGGELDESQTEEMMSAAERRLDRRKNAVAEMQKLIDAGVTSQNALGPVQEDLDAAHKEFDLAESRAAFVLQMAEQARAEQAAEAASQSPEELPIPTDRYDGDGVFSLGLFSKIDAEYARQFGRTLPVSAMGETAVHRSMGFDHRGRVDVAINPDQAEGQWLLEYLVHNKIPYFAFRHAVPGKATGAHIHIGPVSTRIKPGG